MFRDAETEMETLPGALQRQTGRKARGRKRKEIGGWGKREKGGGEESGRKSQLLYSWLVIL